jgi:hypothetical protein
MLVDVSSPPKAAGTNLDKEAGLLARRPASQPPLSVLEGGGVGRRLALAGRRLRTRCVLVDKQGGRGGRLAVGLPLLRQGSADGTT